MKLKNLFYLLLAMPLAFAACEKTAEPEPQPQPDPTPDPQPEYVVDMEMAAGMRVAEIAEMDLQFDENEFMLAFVDETQAKSLTLFIMGEDGQKTLQAGTYTAENDIELGLTAYVVDGEAVAFADANVVVAVDADVYDIEAIFADAEGSKYRFTYEGEIINMGTNEEPEPQPSTPVFELTSNETMEFGQDSAIGTITFNLENPVAGVSVTAKSNQSWINNIAVREADGEIAFMVDANTGAAREAEITATYGVMEFNVTVKQAEYVAPAPELIIDSANEEFEYEGGNGEITFHVKNAVEGVEVAATTAAEWIKIDAVADGFVSYTVALNDVEAFREGAITLTYGELTQSIKIKQYFKGYDPNVTYATFNIIEVRATATSSTTWDLILFEEDPILGEMFTRISVKLPEANGFYITEGTYSMADGSILRNNSNVETTGNSYYRYNGSGAAMTDATLTMNIDKENEKAHFYGKFNTADGEYTFEWNGAVDGFMYEDLGDAGITNWSNFYIYSQWSDCKYIVGEANGVKVEFYLHKLGGSSSDAIAAGTYSVGDWEYETTRDYIENTSKINNVKLQNGGVVTIEEVAEGYNFSFDVTDTNGTNWKGTYVGPITN